MTARLLAFVALVPPVTASHQWLVKAISSRTLAPSVAYPFPVCLSRSQKPRSKLDSFSFGLLPEKVSKEISYKILFLEAVGLHISTYYLVGIFAAHHLRGQEVTSLPKKNVF